MRAAALASGSSGNCFYVEHQDTAVLVDAGLSAKTIFERMYALKLNPAKIKALFITHEHIDHIRGADVLARKLNIPIFATKGTLQSGHICSDDSLLRPLRSDACVEVDDLLIEAFPKLHSAADPVSFTIVGSKRVAVITDVGTLTPEVRTHIATADILFLESNHDVTMLETGPYPHFLKKWVKSDGGHLSNHQAALGILEHAAPQLQHVVLSHLSKTNNNPALALSTLRSVVKERTNFTATLSVSGAHAPTRLFSIL